MFDGPANSQGSGSWSSTGVLDASPEGVGWFQRESIFEQLRPALLAGGVKTVSERTTDRSSAISRRDFLTLSAGVGAIGLAGCGSHSSSAVRRPSLPTPDDAPFDTVVVLMMKNRSFDHFLGCLPRANGRQAGLICEDSNGVSHRTRHSHLTSKAATTWTRDTPGRRLRSSMAGDAATVPRGRTARRSVSD